jgi:hypothetical protein
VLDGHDAAPPRFVPPFRRPPLVVSTTTRGGLWASRPPTEPFALGGVRGGERSSASFPRTPEPAEAFATNSPASEVHMVGRILSFALVAACVATASPALAYDPSDPSGPSPDDPGAWTAERAPGRATRDDRRCVTDMRGSNARPSSEKDAVPHDMETHATDDIDRG